MSRPPMSSAAALAVAALLAGCASPPWQAPPEQAAIKRYYAAHASEKNGRCKAPYIDGFTTVEVVEDTPEGMLVDARYLYRDWVKNGDETPFTECIGYGQRRFLLAQNDERLQVTEMSGPRRN